MNGPTGAQGATGPTGLPGATGPTEWTDFGSLLIPSGSEDVASGGDFYTDAINGVINCGGGIIDASINVISDSTSPSIAVADGDEDLYIDDTLEVSSNSTFKFGGGSWSGFSDRRLKKDIEPYRDGLREIMKILPVWYRYVERLGLDEDERDKQFVGVLAQDMAGVAPYMIEERNLFRVERETADGRVEVLDPGEKFLTYDPSALPYMLVNAVQEQQEMIEELQRQNEELQRRLEALERR